MRRAQPLSLLDSPRSRIQTTEFVDDFLSSAKARETLSSFTYRKNYTGYRILIHERGLEFQADRWKLPDLKKRYGTRSGVTEFSSASRRRLTQLFSRVRHSGLNAPLFVTLTYHYSYFKKKRNFYPDLNTFLQYLRDQKPGWVYIWRLEFQERGAPHWHLILWPPLHYSKKKQESHLLDMRKAWHRIADPTSKVHLKYGFHAKPVESYRKAFSYVSKYTAKESKFEDVQYTGRRWGYSRSLPIKPLAEIEITLETFICLRRFVRKLMTSRRKCSEWFKMRLAENSDLYVYVDLSIVIQWIYHTRPELLECFSPEDIRLYWQSDASNELRLRASDFNESSKKWNIDKN